MTKEKIKNCAGGPAAYEAWAEAITDESQFPKSVSLPDLFERLMCQDDAIDMIGEGRAYAASFLEEVAKQEEKISEFCIEAAGRFKEESRLACKMSELVGGFQRGELQARTLAKPEVRKEIAQLIRQAKELDIQAQEFLEKVIKRLS
jgi:hypothetical protein